MTTLRVELYRVHIGDLVGENDNFDFIFNPAAATEFGLDSPILSTALPLVIAQPNTGKKQRQKFFVELLAEAQNREQLLKLNSFYSHDVIGLLNRYGLDLAGAIQIYNPSNLDHPAQTRLEPLDESDVALMLQNAQKTPFGNKPHGGVSQLPGNRAKILLKRVGKTWNRVLDGYPSSHILTPIDPKHPYAIFDSAYITEIGRALGLLEYESNLVDFATETALVTERFDRSITAPYGLIHVEDFSQALGVVAEEKYQYNQPKTSLVRIAKILRNLTRDDSLTRLLSRVILAVATRDLNLHSKHFALLHPINARPSLAPAFGFETTLKSKHNRLAMAIDGEFDHSKINAQHLIRAGFSWGLRNSAEIVVKTITALKAAASELTPDERANPRLKAAILTNCERLLKQNY